MAQKFNENYQGLFLDFKMNLKVIKSNFVYFFIGLLFIYLVDYMLCKLVGEASEAIRRK